MFVTNQPTNQPGATGEAKRQDIISHDTAGLEYYHLAQLGMYNSQVSLTNLPLDKMADILQMIISDEFSWMENFVFWIKFHWSVFLRDNNPALD